MLYLHNKMTSDINYTMDREINLHQPDVTIHDGHGGFGRSFEVVAAGSGSVLLKGRVDFGFSGSRDNRTFHATAEFEHDPLRVSLTEPLASPEKVVDFIKDDEAVGRLIRTALD